MIGICALDMCSCFQKSCKNIKLTKWSWGGREGVAELRFFLSVSSFLISFLVHIYYEKFSSWLSPHKMFQLQHAHLRHILYFILLFQFSMWSNSAHCAVVVRRWNCSITIISSIAVFKIATELSYGAVNGVIAIKQAFEISWY